MPVVSPEVVLSVALVSPVVVSVVVVSPPEVPEVPEVSVVSVVVPDVVVVRVVVAEVAVLVDELALAVPELALVEEAELPVVDADATPALVSSSLGGQPVRSASRAGRASRDGGRRMSDAYPFCPCCAGAEGEERQLSSAPASIQRRRAATKPVEGRVGAFKGMWATVVPCASVGSHSETRR